MKELKRPIKTNPERERWAEIKLARRSRSGFVSVSTTRQLVVDGALLLIVAAPLQAAPKPKLPPVLPPHSLTPLPPRRLTPRVDARRATPQIRAARKKLAPLPKTGSILSIKPAPRRPARVTATGRANPDAQSIGLADQRLRANATAPVFSLEDAIALSLANNPRRDEAQAAVNAATANIGAVGAQGKFQVGANGTTEYGRNTATSNALANAAGSGSSSGSGSSGSSGGTDGGGTGTSVSAPSPSRSFLRFDQLTLAASQPVIDGGRVRASTRQARYQAVAQIYQLAQTEQDLILGTTLGYLDVLRASQLLRVTNANLSVSQERLRIARLRFGVGASARLDVLRAETDLADARSRRILAVNALGTSNSDLNILLGRAPETPLRLAAITRLNLPNVAYSIAPSSVLSPSQAGQNANSTRGSGQNSVNSSGNGSGNTGGNGNGTASQNGNGNAAGTGNRVGNSSNSTGNSSGSSANSNGGANSNTNSAATGSGTAGAVFGGGSAPAGNTSNATIGATNSTTPGASGNTSNPSGAAGSSRAGTAGATNPTGAANPSGATTAGAGSNGGATATTGGATASGAAGSTASLSGGSVPLGASAGLQSLAGGTRQSLAVTQAQIGAAEAAIEIAKSGKKPQLGLNLSGLLRNPATFLGNFGASIGLGLAQNLFDSGRTRNQVDTARAALAQLQARLAGQRLEVAGAIETSLLSLDSAQRRQANSEAGVRSAREALRVAQIGFRSGVRTTLDLADAQAALLSAQTDAVNARFDVADAQAMLAAGVGIYTVEAQNARERAIRDEQEAAAQARRQTEILQPKPKKKRKKFLGIF